MRKEQSCIDPDKGIMLAAYEMGLLTSDDRRDFERHMALCPACRRQYRAMSPQMTGMPGDPLTPSDSFATGMHSQALDHAGLGDLNREMRREAERSRRRATGQLGPESGGLLHWLRDLARRLGF